MSEAELHVLGVRLRGGILNWGCPGFVDTADRTKVR